jgi:hypothetical protein
MKAYYEDDLVTLYHGDCREVTAWLEADVLVTDPPYGTHALAANPRGGYGRRDTSPHALRARAEGRLDERTGASIANDATTDCRDEVLAMWGARGPALVFGSPRLPDPPGEWADRLVWDKKRPGMNGGPWRYRHETVYVTAGFVRTDNAAVSIIEAWPEDQADHIHAKPQALMTRLVAAAPAGVLADPFAGSGSTLLAAKTLGRRVVGVELEERYCELAAKRLAQDTLFGGVA